MLYRDMYVYTAAGGGTALASRKVVEAEPLYRAAVESYMSWWGTNDPDTLDAAPPDRYNLTTGYNRC